MQPSGFWELQRSTAQVIESVNETIFFLSASQITKVESNQKSLLQFSTSLALHIVLSMSIVCSLQVMDMQNIMCGGKLTVHQHKHIIPI